MFGVRELQIAVGSGGERPSGQDSSGARGGRPLPDTPQLLLTTSLSRGVVAPVLEEEAEVLEASAVWKSRRAGRAGW